MSSISLRQGWGNVLMQRCRKQTHMHSPGWTARFCLCCRKSWWNSASPRSQLPFGPRGRSSAREQQGKRDIPVQINEARNCLKLFQRLLRWLIFWWMPVFFCIALLPLVILLSEDEAKLGARRLARCLQKLGFKVRTMLLLSASVASQSLCK